MTVLVSPPSDTDVDDGPAIAELHRLHAVQREAFLANPYPDAETRQGHLMALAGMLLSHREQIRAAMSADFGSHPDLFTDLVEVLGVAGRAAFAAEQLGSWMAEDQRPTDPALYGTARAGIRYQPKGVVGNIVPWNFPFDLSVGPLVEMLAAGNRVIIKPSDYTPACAQLLR
jgi:coniferyl-aldehyde dehydrogenase